MPSISGNIRPMYKPTNYFSATYPDPYTYLQYWRRRMCYNTYLNYNGIHSVHPANGCVVYDRMVNHTALRI